MIDLANKYQDLLTEIDDLQQNLADSKLKLMEKNETNDLDRQKFEEQIGFLKENEKYLNTQVIVILNSLKSQLNLISPPNLSNSRLNR